MTMLVIDTETTSKAPKPHFGATPHFRDNYIHMIGWLESQSPHVNVGYAPIGPEFSAGDVTMFVGHHVKFDILHLCYAQNRPPRVLLKNATVWCTMVADYILTGQEDKTRSLEVLCAERMIRFVKDPSVMAHFAEGNGADTLDRNVCRDYLVKDVEAARALAEMQMAEMSDSQLTLMTAMMEMVVATAEMEYNGLPWSPTAAASVKGTQTATGLRHATKFQDVILQWCARNHVPVNAMFTDHKVGQGALTTDFVSPGVLGKFLFATELKWDDRETVPTKKGGTRVRKVAKSATVTPFLSSTWSALGAHRTPGGDFALNEKAFEHIIVEGMVDPSCMMVSLTGTTFPTLRAILDNYSEYKASEKITSTYIDGVSKYVIDSYVHCNYNQTVTRTGRLSCSNPNLQNPPPVAKGCYVAPPGWKFLEIDYAQIEVVGLAILSGDKQLLADIRAGRDVHTELYKAMYGREPTKTERGEFKPLTFGLIYGAGDKTLAVNGKVSKATASKFRKTFFDRYPGVQKWYDSLALTARIERVPSGKCSESGIPLGEWMFELPTGRRLLFTEDVLPWDPKTVNFSPSDLANWPVQAFATADIVPTMIGVLMRRLWDSPLVEDALLVCTTHDSVGLLVREEKLDETWKLCYNVLSRTSQIFGDLFKMNIDCPLSFSATVGTTWQQCGDKDNEPLPAPSKEQ